MELHWIEDGDVASVAAASDLFDADAKPEWAARFLADPDHHLCLAFEDGVAVGFVTGVEMTHPDKGTEMFLYELGVDEQYRRRGIGRALVAALRVAPRSAGATGCGSAIRTEPSSSDRTFNHSL